MDNQIHDSEINDDDKKIVADAKPIERDDTLYKLRVQRDAVNARSFKTLFQG